MTTLFARCARVGLGAIALSLALPLEAARADAAGDKVLAAMDEAMNRAQTHVFEFEVTNQEPGKPVSQQRLMVRIKGAKLLAEFIAPADVKGTKLLILAPTEMWVYLPAFGKVRRVNASADDAGFMGLQFSPSDFQTRFSDRYTATVLSQSAAAWRLAATPKAGQTPPCAKIELTLSKDRTLPTELRCFNAASAPTKTETRTGYSCQGNICTAEEDKVVSQSKPGAWTRLKRKGWKVNEPLSDDLFSKRNLER